MPEGDGWYSEIPVLGVARSIRTIASVLVAPPWWTRPGFDSQLPEAAGAPRSEVGAWPLAPSIIGLLAYVGWLGIVPMLLLLATRRATSGSAGAA